MISADLAGSTSRRRSLATQFHRGRLLWPRHQCDPRALHGYALPGADRSNSGSTKRDFWGEESSLRPPPAFEIGIPDCLLPGPSEELHRHVDCQPWTLGLRCAHPGHSSLAPLHGSENCPIKGLKRVSDSTGDEFQDDTSNGRRAAMLFGYGGLSNNQGWTSSGLRKCHGLQFGEPLQSGYKVSSK
jgi:hypothetical protein